jgi:hypothetical protein
MPSLKHSTMYRRDHPVPVLNLDIRLVSLYCDVHGSTVDADDTEEGWKEAVFQPGGLWLPRDSKHTPLQLSMQRVEMLADFCAFRRPAVYVDVLAAFGCGPLLRIGDQQRDLSRFAAVLTPKKIEAISKQE